MLVDRGYMSCDQEMTLDLPVQRTGVAPLRENLLVLLELLLGEPAWQSSSLVGLYPLLQFADGAEIRLEDLWVTLVHDG